MSNVVVERDLGLDDLNRAVRDWLGLGVVVGVRQEKGSDVADGDDINLAQIAAIQEFGSPDQRIPERSFIRSTIDERTSDYKRGLDRAATAGIEAAVAGGPAAGTAAITLQLRRLGQEAADDVAAKIRDLRDPPNSPFTIARKGSSNPLIDTGRLMASIDAEVRKGDGGVE